MSDMNANSEGYPLQLPRAALVAAQIVELNRLRMLEASLPKSAPAPHPARYLVGELRRARSLLADGNVAAALSVMSEALRNTEET